MVRYLSHLTFFVYSMGPNFIECIWVLLQGQLLLGSLITISMSHTQRNASYATAIFGLHIDWTYNATIFETRQEKGAYDQNLQVSVHPMMIYTKNST